MYYFGRTHQNETFCNYGDLEKIEFSLFDELKPLQREREKKKEKKTIRENWNKRKWSVKAFHFI